MTCAEPFNETNLLALASYFHSMSLQALAKPELRLVASCIILAVLEVPMPATSSDIAKSVLSRVLTPPTASTRTSGPRSLNMSVKRWVVVPWKV